MKKVLVPALFFLTSFSFVSKAYADHEERERNKCRSWSKKYVAKTALALACVVPLCLERSASCGYADADCAKSGFGCTATANSHAGLDGLWGSQNSCGGICAGMGADLIVEFGGRLPDEIEYPATQTNKFTTQFQGDYVYLRNIEIVMTSDVANPKLNDYTLTVWLPQDDEANGIEDTVIDREETVQFGKIRLVGGKLSLKGTLFTAADFSITQSGTTVTVRYVGGDKAVYVRNQEQIDVAVSSKGDVTKDLSAVARAAAEQTEKKLLDAGGSLSVHPNPASDMVNIENNVPGFSPATIRIFNQEGRMVKEIKVNTAAAKGTPIAVPVKELTAGEYFIMATDGKEKYLKKFVKQ